MILTGYTHRLDADLAPGEIIAPAYAESGDPALLAAHCLEGVAPALAEQVGEGDVLVVGGALHGGAGAEAAVLALQALGIAAIVCAAADATLATLAGGYGLPLLVSPEAVAALASNQIVRLDLEQGQIEERDSRRRWPISPSSPALIAAVQRAQLLARMRRVVEEEGYSE
ncbi:MAG: hypothetical protein MUD01_06425 [Chloroflexaceae bacterium]|jgi:3-isopropylmalate/(R)-2-methylmalate dehydratase small subunit|nr:hypothetical protein [Chloroflexaceae bacterium]